MENQVEMTREDEKKRIIELKIQSVYLMLKDIQVRFEEIIRLQREVSHGK